MKTPRDRRIEGILDRQARIWEDARVERPTGAGPAVRPNLTLSQRPHSGAEELARLVADRLGWELYDRRLVDTLHENDALGKSVLESLDEHLLSLREDWIYQLFVPGHTTVAGYVHRLSQLVFSIAMRGHNVFLGRGATFIVPRDWRLAVLVTRDQETRVRLYAEANGTTIDEARHGLARLDRVRVEFVSRSLHRHVDDPAVHDLCINLDRLGVDQAASLILQALSQRFPELVRAQSTG